MKVADILINNLFSLNRKDLLNDLNIALIRDYRRIEVIRGAINITGSGGDLDKDSFYNWHHKENFKDSKIIDYFKYATEKELPPHPHIHKHLRIEHDSDRINDFIKAVVTPDITPEVKIDKIISLYQQVIQNTENKKVHSMKDMLKEYISKLTSGEPDEYLNRSVKLGTTWMHNLMGSSYLFPRIHTVLGFPGTYKTSILINIMAYLMRVHDKKGLYFSLEDSRFVLQKKWLALEIDLPKNDLIQNKVPEDKIEELRKISKDNLFIVDSGCSNSEISTIIESQIAKTGLDFIMLDFVQLIRNERGHTKRDTINNFMEMMKDMCAKHLVSCFILTQSPKASTENKDKLLGMGDEKESAGISELARWSGSTNHSKEQHEFDSNHQLIWNLYKGEMIGKATIDINPKTGKILNVTEIRREG